MNNQLSTTKTPYFELQPDSSFLQSPKIELHRHLEGSLRWSSLKKWATADEPSLKNLTDEELKELFLVRTPFVDLKSVLQKFVFSQKVLHSSDRILQMAFEAVEDAAKENIKILELRYAPTFLSGSKGFEHWQLALQAINAGLQKARDFFDIEVGLIAILQRTQSPEINSSVTDFIINNKQSFVGVDLADNESGNPSEKYIKFFKRFAAAGLPITIHAGEANEPGSADNVKSAILELGAQRIGHGIQIYKSKEITNLVIKEKVTLEVCPTSNYLTAAVSELKQHPFRQLLDSGVRMTLNSDDPDLFAINLSHEWKVLQVALGFSELEILQLQSNAFAASFINEKNKARFKALFID